MLQFLSTYEIDIEFDHKYACSYPKISRKNKTGNIFFFLILVLMVKFSQYVKFTFF